MQEPRRSGLMRVVGKRARKCQVFWCLLPMRCRHSDECGREKQTELALLSRRDGRGLCVCAVYGLSVCPSVLCG